MKMTSINSQSRDIYGGYFIVSAMLFYLLVVILGSLYQNATCAIRIHLSYSVAPAIQ